MSKRCSLCLSSSCVTEFRLLSKFFINPDIDSIRSQTAIHTEIYKYGRRTGQLFIIRFILLRAFFLSRNCLLYTFSKTRDKASMGTLSITAIMQPKNIGLIMSKNLPIPPNIFPYVKRNRKADCHNHPKYYDIYLSFYPSDMNSSI